MSQDNLRAEWQPIETAPKDGRDVPLWFREDRVFDALQIALREAIRNGGQPAKAFAWDVQVVFRRTVRAFGETEPQVLPAPPETAK